MDPNHWNAYNLQYTGSPGGLAPPHSSLNRLELPSGLNLGHTFQTSHSSLPGRSMSTIPAVNYGPIGVPLLDPMTPLSGITGLPGHKTSLAQSQLMFDPQLRGTPGSSDQGGPSISRYDNAGSNTSSNKIYRSESLSPCDAAVAKNQIFEVASARVWGNPNFSASSLYNQFSSMMSEVPVSANSLFSSPSSGSHVTSQKSNESSLHDPPPAHSSGIPRVSLVQRAPSHSSDLPYGRSPENLIPSPLSQVGSLYSPSVEKEALSSNTQSSSLHRQTPVHTQQHGYSSSRDDIEDLSSNSQNPLYGSYANLTSSDSHDFNTSQMSTEMNYEAVSPALPINNTASNHPDNPSFSMVSLSEFANLATEHTHNLTEKFQENDFRLKLDSRLHHQANQDANPFPHLSQDRHSLSCLSKSSKDLGNFAQSGQTSHRSAMMQPSSVQASQVIQTVPTSLNHQTPNLQPVSLTSPTSLQQSQNKPPIQALADSTTKPKRRSRKRKDSNIAIPSSNADNVKKSSVSQESLDTLQRQQGPQHSSHLLSVPPASHISTLSHPSYINQSSQLQPQVYGMSGANQFSNGNSHRAQTPSMPQNFSNQDPHLYAPAPSPKLSLESNHSGIRQSDFKMSSRLANEKVGPYKQVQRKSKHSVSDSSINQNNSHMYQTNIPADASMDMQSYPGHNTLLNQSGHRDSPMQDVIHGSQHIPRLSSFSSDQSQQSSIANQLSRISQQSPQGSLPVENTSYSNKKLRGSGHFIGSSVMNNLQQSGNDTTGLSSGQPHSQSPLGPNQGNVESSPMPHTFDSTRNPTMVEQQDPGQFHMDFGGQPFLEQLVGVQNPVPIATSSFSNSGPESGEVVFTSLGSAPESTPLHHQQHQQSNEEHFRPTAYQDESINEVRPVVTLSAGLTMEEDASFNPFFENQPTMEFQATPQSQQMHYNSAPPEPEPLTLTFVPTVGEDDDFNHFSDDPMTEVRKEQNKPLNKSDSFQDSFLSYLQGNKQETLSSVSSAAITKRPQLPKYIPEPRRPRPTPPLPVPPAKETNKSTVEESVSQGKDALASSIDTDSASQKSENGDKDGYSVKHTSELVFKITLPKGQKKKINDSVLLSHNRKMKESYSKVKKKRGKRRDLEAEDYSFGPAQGKQTAPTRKPSPPPVRPSIGRKAKEKIFEKSRKQNVYGDSGSSTEEEIFPMFAPLKKFTKEDSDQNYDSDKDPVWMPFEVDLKSGYDLDERRKKPKKQRARLPMVKSGRPPASKPPASSSSISTTHSLNIKPSAFNPSIKPSSSPAQSSIEKVNEKRSNIYTAGQYLIEKKDLQNYDKYPIWRLEDHCSRIHKFEVFVEKGEVRHKAVDTFSTWMASMHSQFQLIKVNEVNGMAEGGASIVQVLEEFRPKQPDDGNFIMQYEDDPLVDQFNIYLQVFISQALQPNFLKTIIDRKETFYVDAIDFIDKTVDAKLTDLAKQARWTVAFKEALLKLPYMKEIDRPNLKQACQACENSSPPTIKSIVLSGHAYDKVLLTDKSSSASEVQEYMIGKTAAFYVRTYHSLCHFKYWLWQRCDSKVKVLRESSKPEPMSDEMVLERCLGNRNWVLQLFDDLKKLLAFSNDAPR